MGTWDESEHPRDDEGKFTYKNGGSSGKSEEEKMQRRADLLYPSMKDKEPKTDYSTIGLGNYKKEKGYVTGGAANIDNSNTVKTIDNTVFSDNALKKTRSFITKAEDFKADAYKDQAGKWTIGYGHTGKVDGKEITAGMKITQEKAEELYRKDFEIYSKTLKHVKVSLTENEKVALTSFIYNVGEPRFLSSSVFTKINQGDRKGAADAMLLYNKVTTKKEVNGKIISVKVFSQGLYNRRIKERNLFLTPDEK